LSALHPANDDGAARAFAFDAFSGGITVPDSWDIASQSINNLELRRRSQAVLPMIREGRAFTEALDKAGWMPELALDMIGIGEKSGSLREMLDEVANFTMPNPKLT
jgi:type IV pilus assembly protein PilC